MDSADAAASPLGAWAWIRGYFTPATLFLFVNLVIGTIALTSRFTEHRRRSREHYYHHDAHGHAHYFQEQPLHAQMEQQPGYGGSHYYHAEQTLYAAPPPPAPAPLARTSSVLDRLRSLGLYRFRSGDFPPEFGAAAAPAAPSYAQDVYAPVEEEETAATAHYARSRAEPALAAEAREDERMPAPVPPRVKMSAGSEVRKSQVARAVPRVVKAAVAEDDDDSVEASRAAEAVGGFRRGPSPLQQEHHYQEEVEYVPPVRARAPAAPAPLQRAPSVLERLRSFGLYGFLAPDQPAAAADGFATPADEKTHAHEHYDRSRSEPAPEQQGKKGKKAPEAKSRMAKASSEARKAPAPRPAEAGGGECVNARAEAFIDSFRQQQQQGVVHHYQEPEEEEYVPPPAPLPRTSSVLDRLRSFSLYRFRSGDLGPDLPAAETDEKEKQQQQPAAQQYGRSRSEPAKKKQQEARIKSSSSGVVEEAAETEECVDARADDFINKFRQQLQLQRLNSLLNYKEMLGGGGKQ